MQTILTQCPRCQTSFKVSDKQLAIASGMVRCGSCLDVFSATENRITIKQPLSAAPPPENFPDEDYENEGDIHEQPTPISSPSFIEDTKPYYPETSLPTESSAFQPTYEAPTSYSAGPETNTGTASSGAVSETPSSSDDEFEFILDYEDDIQLGDMMLDEAVTDELVADVLDVDIHDAGNVTESNAYTDSGNTSEASDKEYGKDASTEIEYIHETAFEPVNPFAEPEFHTATPDAFARHEDSPVSNTDTGSGYERGFPEAGGTSLQAIVRDLQETTESIENSEPTIKTYEEPEEIIAFAAREPDVESSEPSSPFTNDLQRTDYGAHDYSSHTEQPAFDQTSNEVLLTGFDITPAEETTVATDTTHDPQSSPEDAVENIQAQNTTTEPQEIFAHRPATDRDDPENLNPEDSFTADDFADTDDGHAPGFSALSSDGVEEIELTAAAASKPHTQRDKEELRQYLAELEDADALEPLPPTTMDSIEIDPLTFEVGHVFRKYVTTFGWFVLSMVLLAVLVLQVVASNLEFMQQSPSYSRYLPLFCRVLECPEPERVTAIQSLNSQDLLVRSHPSVADALEVSFIFRNDADMPQPFPLVELSFMDSSRNLMANRLLKPEEYLPPELAVLDEMPASSSVQVTLEMTDPGSDAVNYEIGFRDPATENPQ